MCHRCRRAGSASPTQCTRAWQRLAGSPFLLAVACGIALSLGCRDAWTWSLAALSWAAVTLVLATSRHTYRAMGVPRRYVVFYPLGVLATLRFQLGAMARCLGLATVTWHGTRYRRGKRIG